LRDGAAVGIYCGMNKKTRFASFAEIINAWPPSINPRRTSMQLFAEDMALPYTHANLLRQRNSIPPKYWPRLIEKAKQRRVHGVNKQLLADLAIARDQQAA
jgi:hypothetical protein